MTFIFDESVVNDGTISFDSWNNCQFIGFLNPKGEKIDYSDPLGSGHGSHNIITQTFQAWFYDKRYNLSECNWSVENQIEQCKTIRSELKDIIKSKKLEKAKALQNKYGFSSQNQLLLDLYEFYYNCYKNDLFKIGFNHEYKIMNKTEFYNSAEYFNIRQKYPKKSNENDWEYNLRIPSIYQFQYMYWKYQSDIYANLFKDIMIQYLGYHSIERIPRTITTSETRIYSTFYNYLKNGFTIVRIPKMIYDEQKNMYTKYNLSDFLMPDSELRLKAEIESHKKQQKKINKYKKCKIKRIEN